MLELLKTLWSQLLCKLGLHVGPVEVKQELIEETGHGYFSAIEILKRHPAGAAVRKATTRGSSRAPRTYVEWVACVRCGRDLT